MNLKITYLTSLLIILFTAPTIAAEYTINQKNKQFSKNNLSIKVGDTVSFKNSDPFFHNVYSESDTKNFDLGYYRKGMIKDVTFDKPGNVYVECHIHPNMKLTISIEE